MTEQEVQAVIDELFAVIESHESGLALKLTQAMQAAIDQYLPQVVERVNRRLAKTPPA